MSFRCRRLIMSCSVFSRKLFTMIFFYKLPIFIIILFTFSMCIFPVYTRGQLQITKMLSFQEIFSWSFFFIFPHFIAFTMTCPNQFTSSLISHFYLLVCKSFFFFVFFFFFLYILFSYNFFSAGAPGMFHLHVFNNLLNI